MQAARPERKRLYDMVASTVAAILRRRNTNPVVAIRGATAPGPSRRALVER